MGNFAEVLTLIVCQNVNKISDKIGKTLETFNNSLTAYSKAKDCTGVATISINPNKSHRAVKISVNPRIASSVNVSVKDDGSSSQDCQEKATDMKNGKKKHVTNFNTNIKVV